MLKGKMTKEEWEKLTDEQKACYNLSAVEGSEDEYVVDGVKALEMAEKHREHKERAIASKIAKDGDVEALTKEKEEALKDKGDYKGLYELEQQKSKELGSKNETLAATIDNFGVDTTLSSEKSKVLTKLIDGSNKGLEKYIDTRIIVKNIDGKPHTIVTDEDGNNTTASVSDLIKEVQEMDDFKSILKGRDSSGGGAHGGGGGGGLEGDKYRKAFDKDTRDVGLQKELLKKDPKLFQKYQTEAHAKRMGKK